MAILLQIGVQSPRLNHRAPDPCPAQERAMALWPRLDRRALTRCGCDPTRIARYVSHRTTMPPKAIESLLSQAERRRATTEAENPSRQQDATPRSARRTRPSSAPSGEGPASVEHRGNVGKPAAADRKTA
jgi:hypothetical protein